MTAMAPVKRITQQDRIVVARVYPDHGTPATRLPICSPGAETLWLPTLGPTGYLCARWLDRHCPPGPTAYTVHLALLAGAIGVRADLAWRSGILRLVRFGWARWHPANRVENGPPRLELATTVPAFPRGGGS